MTSPTLTNPLHSDARQRAAPLPLSSLLALALAGFITILTEALPAGLLPRISADLQVSEALAGQWVSVYALGSLMAAIPLVAMTQHLNRRPLLLAAIFGFAFANTVTTLSDSYALSLLARLIAGVSAGLLWALLAGYAARLVAPHQQGRAIAIAMVGTPLALSLGVPAGTWLGNLLGWRLCFGLMSVLALLLMAWIRLRLPDFASVPGGARLSLRQVLKHPGIRPVLCVVLGYVLAHNLLYTYIAPFLAHVAMGAHTERVLLVFGIMALPGIWIVGVLIDRHLRVMTLSSIGVFALAAVLLGVAGQAPWIIYLAVALWGLAFGGAATLFQTALARRAGSAADVAQSMLVTAWNLAIAGGGLLGGWLLQSLGAGAFAPAILVLLLLTLIAAWPRPMQ